MKILERRVGVLLIAGLIQSCATLPEEKHGEYEFPAKRAFMNKPKRPHKVLGEVKSKVNFSTLDIEQDNHGLCENYFNKSVGRLVEFAEEKGGDAVIEVRSVVFFLDGKVSAYPGAECFDDGSDGQVLTRGLAVKWLKSKRKAGK